MQPLNINDLKDPEFPKKSTLFRTVGSRMENGRFIGTRYTKIVSQDTIYVPGSSLIKCKAGQEKELHEVTITYFTSIPREKKNEDGDISLIGTIGDILFDRGVLTVKPTDKRLYKYLFYSNVNSTNPHATNPNKKFYEDRPTKKLEESNSALDAIMEAVNLAEKMEDDDLMEFAFAINQVDEDVVHTRMKMKAYAYANPKDFIKQSTSTTRRTQAVVNEAIALGLLENIQNTGEWNLINDEDKKRTLLIRAPVGVDQAEWFVKWLSKNNRSTDTLLLNNIKEKKEKDAPIASNKPGTKK